MDSYKIKKGDTLGAIAKRYNVSVSDLAIANNISNPNKIREGLTLTIPEATKKFSQKELVKVYKTEKPVYDTKKLYQGLDTEKIDNEKVVRDYMKGKEEYILIDKKTNTLRKFDKQGNEVVSFRVGLGKDKGDKFTINSKNEKIDRDVTGAGIYTTDKKSNKESYAHDYENNILLLKNESGLRQAMSIHQIPNSLKEKRTKLLTDDNLTNDDFSNGCVNCTKEQFEKYLKVVQPGQKVIVLPEEEGNYFTVKGNKLSFTTNKDKEFGQYNYTPKTKEVTPFNLKPKESSEYKEKFIDALTKEKANLIKDLKISNEDYDELAKRAYGIFGQESSFGEGSWNPAHNYKAEELYTILFDKPEERKNRSLGLTQVRLKHVNQDFAKKYNINNETLYYPYQAALATMERLADSYQAIKNPKVREKYKEMTPENSYDYAVTFYNKPETVRQGKASGNNQYVKQVKQFYSELEPEQTVASYQDGGRTMLGYRYDSPFKNEPYIDIQSNNIDMSQTDKDLILIPNKGKPVVAKAGSGGYLFPNSTKVTEVPLYQAGGISMKPVSPFMDLKMFKNRYKLEQLPTYQDGGILDNYIKTLPEEQQNVFMGEFQSLEPEVQQEVIFMLGGKYQMGGTAEVEGDETAVTPDSELVEFKGKKHKDGGIKVDLPNGTRIYSEYSKAPQEIVEQVLGKKTKGKMSYADLSKKFPTKPYMEILEDDKSDEYEKNGAQLKLMNNLSKLDTIFYAQEAEKKQVEGKFQQGGTFNGGKFGGSGQGVNFDWTNYTFPIGNSILDWQATDKNKSRVFSHPEEGGNFYTDEQPSLPGFSPIRDNTQYPWREPYPTVTTGVRLPLMEPKLNLTNVTDDKPAPPPAKVRGKQPPTKSKPVSNSGDSDSNLLEIPLPFGQPPTANLSNRQVTSIGVPETSPTLNEGDNQSYSLDQNTDDKDYPKRSRDNNFGISSKLAGTIADIGLALSDKLRVSEPTLYDRRKYPLFTRFVDFDDKEVQRMYDKGIQQIQNSNLPEAQKQAQVSELLAKYQDYQGKVGYNNLQRYEGKREADTNKLQQYLDQNIDIKVADTQDYKERKARVDFLRDQFLAQRKSRVVNSLKAYADYADKINMANQLYTDNYTINPITGRINYKPDQKSNLTQDLLEQYAKNAQNKVNLGNGLTGVRVGNKLIVTNADGTKFEAVNIE